METKIKKIQEILGEHGEPQNETFIIREVELRDGILKKVVISFDENSVITSTTMNGIEISQDFSYYEDLNERIIDDMILFLEQK